MVCQWAFRTFSPKNDTEVRNRGVPGIRVPGGGKVWGLDGPLDWLDLNFQGSKKVRRSPADMGNIPLFSGFYTSQVVRELLVLEILHQLMCGLSHYLQGLGYIPGGCLGFLPSTVAPENVWLEGKPFLLGRPIFRGYVSFREGTLPKKKKKLQGTITYPTLGKGTSSLEWLIKEIFAHSPSFRFRNFIMIVI